MILVANVPSLRNPATIVVMILSRISYSSSFSGVERQTEHDSSPDKLVASVADQFDSAGPATPYIKQIDAEFDEAEFDNDDHHGAEEGCAEDFRMEFALQTARETAQESVGDESHC